MSIVTAFLYRDFALICGDTLLVKPDGSHGTIKKIHKSSNNIAFGMTGDVNNNVEFFSPFFNNNFAIDESVVAQHTFNSIVESLDQKFELNMKLGTVPENFDIAGVVVGWDGEKFACHKYMLSPPKKDREVLCFANYNEIQIIHLGMAEHLQNFMQLFDPSKFNSYQYLLEVYQLVLLMGATFDNTISTTEEYILLFT